MDNTHSWDLIENAINESLKTFEDYEEGDILVEWAVVGYVTNANPEKGDTYPLLYSNGTIPTYRARGLYHTALKLIGDESQME